jgi:hypothetical protein
MDIFVGKINQLFETFAWNVKIRKTFLKISKLSQISELQTIITNIKIQISVWYAKIAQNLKNKKPTRKKQIRIDV